MLQSKKLSTNRTGILSLVAVTLVSLIGYLLYDNFIASTPNKTGLDQQVAADLSIELPQVKIEFITDFLGIPPYTELQRHGNYPVEVGVVGKANPFSISKKKK